MGIKWNQETEAKFNQIVDNLPQFHRNIAQQLVREKAEAQASERGSELVEDRDLIIAFFREVPPAFKEMMKRLFNHLGIDYARYISQ